MGIDLGLCMKWIKQCDGKQWECMRQLHPSFERSRNQDHEGQRNIQHETPALILVLRRANLAPHGGHYKSMPFIFAHRKRARCFRRKPSAHPQRPF